MMSKKFKTQQYSIWLFYFYAGFYTSTDLQKRTSERWASILGDSVKKNDNI